MRKYSTSLLLFVGIGSLLQDVTGQQCSLLGVSGMVGCECNFIEACDAQGNPKSNWAQYLPTGVDQYGLVESGQQNLAYRCEAGAVAILYDCNNRIPLYAVTVLDGTQLLAPSSGGRPTNHFRRSGRQNQLDTKFQQSQSDYVRSSLRELCYTSRADDYNYIVDNDWVSGVTRKRYRTGHFVCPGGPSVETEINKGHMIASQYGRGNPARMRATFTYTNVVPQFGVFNQGPWQVSESRLISWGSQNCANVKGATNVQLFIVVGAIPSTVFGFLKQRYFGQKGFSDYKDYVYGDYRVNVPKFMWTAACCKYVINGALKYQSTAFYRENNPGNAPCDKADVSFLSRWLSRWASGGINLFPQTPQCNNANNYVPLP